MLKKSETVHSIAMARHEKLQSELCLKRMMVELVHNAWESAKRDAHHVEEMIGKDSSLVAKEQNAVTPERKKWSFRHLSLSTLGAIGFVCPHAHLIFT